MSSKKVIMTGIAAVVAMTTLVACAEPTVTDVVAKQRYPWNGLVDITCKVTGLSTAGDEFYLFSVAVVMPDSGNVCNVSNLWVVKSGTKSTDRSLQANGSYRLLWDAKADLGQVVYSNMIMRVTIDTLRDKVQLWEGGPYWAGKNIGAQSPWEYGYYFWWGDTIGYKLENNKWVASDGSSSNFSFGPSNTPTYDKSIATLKSEGWITAEEVLAPEHDAAHVQWGGAWRMPTKQELTDLISKCAWTWTTQNGVQGYVVKGNGTYAFKSIFLPCAGTGNDTSLYNSGGDYWPSVPLSVNSGGYYNSSSTWCLDFGSSGYGMRGCGRYLGFTVRPVQGFTN